jgi:hypothetical protein
VDLGAIAPPGAAGAIPADAAGAAPAVAAGMLASPVVAGGVVAPAVSPVVVVPSSDFDPQPLIRALAITPTINIPIIFFILSSPPSQAQIALYFHSPKFED